MKRLLVILVLGLAACGGDNAATTVTSAPYNEAAVSHTAAAMVADKDLLEPNGQPLTPNDFNALLAVVKEACIGPGKMQAMIQQLSRSPYLLAKAMHLANVGCPKLISDMGITVNDE